MPSDGPPGVVGGRRRRPRQDPGGTQPPEGDARAPTEPTTAKLGGGAIRFPNERGGCPPSGRALGIVTCNMLVTVMGSADNVIWLADAAAPQASGSHDQPDDADDTRRVLGGRHLGRGALCSRASSSCVSVAARATVSRTAPVPASSSHRTVTCSRRRTSCEVECAAGRSPDGSWRRPVAGADPLSDLAVLRARRATSSRLRMGDADKLRTASWSSRSAARSASWAPSRPGS